MLALVVAAAGTFAIVARLPASRLEPQAAGPPDTLGRVAAQAGTLVSKVLTPSHQPAARPTAQATATPARPRPPLPPPPVYLNPLRDVAGLLPQRVDMGVDFQGSGPIYALGDAVIASAESDNAGWPDGGWITYQLTGGPAAGLMVYVAEDVQPAVQPGEHVTSSTVIAQMSDGGAGIETGWAMPDGASAVSQLAIAGGIGGGGPFPTEVGLSFEALLIALGVPAAPNAGQPGSGLLPANIPARWPGLSP